MHLYKKTTQFEFVKKQQQQNVLEYVLLYKRKCSALLEKPSQKGRKKKSVTLSAKN